MFFAYLGPILALGIVGTGIAFLLTAAFLWAGFAGFRLLRLQDCLALGAIFSATDSVATLQGSEAHPTTFMGTVGGDMLATFLYLFITSLSLGVVTGLGTSYLVTRFAGKGPHHEVAMIGLLSYLSYLVAEVAQLSGILSLFCCAIIISHLALPNLSLAGRSTTLNAFKTLSYISEGTIFIYLGMDALDPNKWESAHVGEALSLCGVLLLLLLLSRAASVIPIITLYNWTAQTKISTTDIFVIW
ncbi:Na_H_Exchanger domain-containing protein [Haematococcus lacustris]|uniref:Na_H_Exchanger domain-containing protein n=1 Tax=Haematococcus lacustris TaxID=44745 RepID=A0A6A0ACM0_HAELA|nr:Na_H_Exchanger domain-containing protein [Haematococcus lacustris]